MTRKEIEEVLYENTSLKRGEATRVLDIIADTLEGAMMRKEPVMLRRFGRLHVVQRKTKKVQDICKRRTVVLPPHYTVKFEISKILKKKLNGQK